MAALHAHGSTHEHGSKLFLLPPNSLYRIQPCSTQGRIGAKYDTQYYCHHSYREHGTKGECCLERRFSDVLYNGYCYQCSYYPQNCLSWILLQILTKIAGQYRVS